MSFWLVAAKEGETPDTITLRAWIAKPQFDQNDYSKAKAPKEIKRHLLKLDEDMPPETVAIRTQEIWQFVHGIDVEDIICMVWFKKQKPQGVCFAEVTGRVYAEMIGENSFEHRVPIRWYEEQAGMLRLRPYIVELSKAGYWPTAISNAKFKLALRNHLPLPGNKFVKWTWLILLLIGIKVFMMAIRTWNRV